MTKKVKKTVSSPMARLWVGFVPKTLLDNLEEIRLNKGWNKQITMEKVIINFVETYTGDIL